MDFYIFFKKQENYPDAFKSNQKSNKLVMNRTKKAVIGVGILSHTISNKPLGTVRVQSINLIVKPEAIKKTQTA